MNRLKYCFDVMLFTNKTLFGWYKVRFWLVVKRFSSPNSFACLIFQNYNPFAILNVTIVVILWFKNFVDGSYLLVFIPYICK